jgi:tetratricopeptide (TPR) repeat protein
MASKTKRDFFISYNKADRQWAEWIGWVLEEAGYSTLLQAGDLRPASNFVVEMQNALDRAERTIAVISPSYLRGFFTQQEWAAAFAQDPVGEHGRLIPVRVRECKLTGLLASVVYVDLVSLGEEKARNVLISAVEQSRARPARQPAFPGSERPIWHVPHSRNPNFTGMEPALSKLRKNLTSGKPTAVTQAIKGLGGVGKTQVALEYVYRYAGEYSLVWWIRAEDKSKLNADFAALAQALDLPEKDDKDQNLVVQAVCRRLNELSNWLLVYDNVTRPEDLGHCRPQAPTGHVIITSRYQNWQGVAESLSLDVMEPDEAATFLKRRTGLNDDQAAGALAAELGYLPLALEQVGAYIEKNRSDFASYQKLFTTRRKELLELLKPSEDYPFTIATTWDMAFKQAAEETPAAVELLKLCACLAPDDIPLSIIREGAKHLPGQVVARASRPCMTLQSAVSDELKWDQVKGALLAYSLIDVGPDSISVHPLVQAVTRDRMTGKERKTWVESAIAIVNRAFPFDSDDYRTWATCSRLLPHAIAAAREAELAGLTSESLGRLLNQAAGYLWGRAQYADAEPLYRRGLAILEKQLGPEHPNMASALNNLAGLLYAQGKYADAEPLYRRALAIGEKTLGPDHPNVASALNNLAALLKAQGRYADAEPLYRRALAIGEKALGPDHPDVARDLNNLASLLQAQGQYAAAEPLYRRALAIDEKALGPSHPGVATDLNNLAELLRAQGQYADAEPLFRRALAIAEKTLGKDHPNTKTCAENLARLLAERKASGK